jgi:ribosomal protein L17
MIAGIPPDPHASQGKPYSSRQRQSACLATQDQGSAFRKLEIAFRDAGARGGYVRILQVGNRSLNTGDVRALARGIEVDKYAHIR